MSIKLKKQAESTVRTPGSTHVQFFVDSDGLPKLKDSDGLVINSTYNGTVVLDELGAAPGPDTNKSKLYGKDVAGITEFFVQDSAGQEVQITSNGGVAGASGGAASSLETTGAPVVVDGSAPPALGQTLIATSPTTATWQTLSVSIATGVSGLGSGVSSFLATPNSANLRTALTDETGTGAAVFATSPTLVTPVLGTPTSGTLTNCTGLPVSTGVSGLGAGVATFMATPSSANLAAALTDETGTGSAVFATSPTLTTPILTTPNIGTPSAGTLTSCTGLPISTGVSGLGSGVATFLGTPSSANLATALTDKTGTGVNVFATSPSLVTPALGTPSALVLTNATGRASSSQTADQIATSGTAVSINSTAPSTGQVLTATSTTAASWQTPTGGPASQIATSGTPVTISSTAPTANQILQASSSTAASWVDKSVAIGTQVTGLGTGVATFLGTPSSANLASAVTDETGSGALVFATSPTLVTPALGTPSALVLTNATGRTSSSQTADQIATSGTAVSISSTAPSTGQVLTATSATGASWQAATGGPASQIATSGTPVTISSTAPTANQILQASSSTAASWVDKSVAIGTQVTGLGTGIATFLGTPSSANLASALTDKTGTGVSVFATSPTLTTPALGTPSSLVLTNATGRASSAQTADQIATSGTAVTISSTAPTTGQVLTATSATAANWQTPTAGGGTVTSELWSAPASPHADDDEFTGALSGSWNFYSAAGTAVASSTTLDPYGLFNSGTTKIKYQANDADHPSWLRFQHISDNNPYAIAKAITATTNMAVWARLRGNAQLPTSANNNEGSLSLALFGNNAGIPDVANNFLQIGFDINPGSDLTILFAKTEGGTTTAINQYANSGTPPFTYFMIHKIGSNYHGWAFNAAGRSYYLGVTTHAATMTFGGYRLANYAASALPGNAILGSDFFRRVDSATFFPI